MAAVTVTDLTAIDLKCQISHYFVETTKLAASLQEYIRHGKQLTLVSSSQSRLSLRHKHPWGGAGWGRCAELCGSVPPPSAGWPDGPGWVWGGTWACEPAPGRTKRKRNVDVSRKKEGGGEEEEKKASAPHNWMTGCAHSGLTTGQAHENRAAV